VAIARSAVLLVAAAATMIGAVAILNTCREGTAWRATSIGFFAASAAAVALATFLALRQRESMRVVVFLLTAMAYAAVAYAVIEDVGDHCFH